jgi:hypothetical protein
MPFPSDGSVRGLTAASSMSGAAVGQGHDAVLGPRVRESRPDVCTGSVERLRAVSYRDEMHEEVQLVQELGDRLGDIALDDLGVLPLR